VRGRVARRGSRGGVMSDGGPGPAPFQRPRWMLPVAIIGAVLILLGVVLTVDWGGGDDDPGPQITGTTLPG
jgi:hypothetical protein